jgi:hypothetical protein
MASSPSASRIRLRNPDYPVRWWRSQLECLHLLSDPICEDGVRRPEAVGTSHRVLKGVPENEQRLGSRNPWAHVFRSAQEDRCDVRHLVSSQRLNSYPLAAIKVSTLLVHTRTTTRWPSTGGRSGPRSESRCPTRHGRPRLTPVPRHSWSRHAAPNPSCLLCSPVEFALFSELRVVMVASVIGTTRAKSPASMVL